MPSNKNLCSHQHIGLVNGQVELEATTEDPGTTLRAPTSEAGLAPACKDTCFGDLKLKMWERRYDGSKGKVHIFSLIHTRVFIGLVLFFFFKFSFLLFIFSCPRLAICLGL